MSFLGVPKDSLVRWMIVRWRNAKARLVRVKLDGVLSFGKLTSAQKSKVVRNGHPYRRLII